MDPAAFVAANRLVGNGPAVAALEITLAGPLLRTTQDTLIAICGASFEVWVDRIAVPGWHSVFARAGSLIRFGPRQRGVRAYFSVAGGIVVPPFLGSASTYVLGGFGGVEGRALRAGDRLQIGADPLRRQPHELWAGAGERWPLARRPGYTDSPTLRILFGPQDDHFAPDALESFVDTAYVVSPASDRMGIRLEGSAIRHSGPAGIVSDGVISGSIQIPPDGRPIVMMVDHQTTGGYPKIGTVIQADLALLAQCLPGDRIRFRVVSAAEALAAGIAFLEGLWKSEHGGAVAPVL
jgi:antagonist of KipI